MSSPSSYLMIRTISSGTFGYVFQAQNKKTQEMVALKRLEKVNIKNAGREVQILYMIKGCENVIELKDMFYTSNSKGKLIQNMVFEFAQDSLDCLITQSLKENRRIAEKEIKNYIYQILNGLNQIHSKKIVHRDIKPENVLISKEGAIKICDFGSSKLVCQKNTPMAVSRYYRCPQLCLYLTKYGCEVDIWSVGCILAELFLLTPIFAGKTDGDQILEVFKILGSFNEVEQKYFAAKIPFQFDLLSKFPKCKKTNLRQMFHMVEDRQNFLDLLHGMLQYIPQKRITARQALLHPFFAQIQPNIDKFSETDYSGQL